jgi:hypothetical protein
MTPRPHTVPELLHHWPAVCRKATGQWAKAFAGSIWRQMVQDLFACGRADDPQLIEDGCDE